MKKLISLFVLMSLVSNLAFADCDWSKIKDNGDGTYTYTKELHLCVGQLKQDNKVKDQQIADYQKAIQLKDLALTTSDDRANRWMNNSLSLESKLTEVDSLQKKNDFLYFGLGILVTIGAGFMTARLLGK
jgi:hypothetical protein